MFKIIKSTDWTSKKTGSTGTTYTLAYKGRIMILNSNDFDLKDIVIDAEASTLKINTPMSVIEQQYQEFTPEGTVNKTGLKLMPKFDLDIDQF